MQRHRNHANGFRLNPIGVGGSGGPGYRNFNRGGFGRGQPPPPRRIDVFMEAGKLAAEYLISKGFTPPSSGNGKWQNPNLKNPICSGVSDSVLGTGTGSGTGSGRTRVTDDGITGRKTFSETGKILSDKHVDLDDGISGSMEEQKSESRDLDSAAVNEENRPISDVLDQNLEAKSDCKNVDSNTEMQIVEEELPEAKTLTNPEKPDNSANCNEGDLLTLIRFEKIPTRKRSSVTLKGSKTDPVLVPEDENKAKIQNSAESEPADSSSLQDNEDDEEMKPIIEQIPSEDDEKYKFTQELSGEKRPLEFNDSAEISKKPCNSSYGEEKQFFPNSFKICDLNLTGGGSDAGNSVAGFSSIGQLKQESGSVDFDLGMNSSSCDLPNRHMRPGSDGKEVEVIDLDCDSVQDDNNSERRDEAIFTDLGSFPDSTQRGSGIPQDGYGLMISELLDADIPNSSVPGGVHSMHNELSLQNDEGILNDDESIYMSLGEIPISFVPVWDPQPAQRYDKRY